MRRLTSLFLFLLASILLGGVAYTANYYTLFTTQTELLLLIDAVAAVTGAVICGAMGVQVWRRGVVWWRVMALISAVTVYTTVRLTIFARADYDRQRLPFLWSVAAAFTLVTIVLFVQKQRKRLRTKESTKHGLKPEI